MAAQSGIMSPLGASCMRRPAAPSPARKLGQRRWMTQRSSSASRQERMFCALHTRRAYLAQALGLTLALAAAHPRLVAARSTDGSTDGSADQVVLGGVEDPMTAPPVRLEHKGRIVAIGDLHGDLRKTLVALKVAGVIEEDDGRPVWCGGDTLVVQVGDILDRGDNEVAILSLLREIGRMARQDGGDVIVLNGNHESLNVAGDFRYVTPGAFVESAIAAGLRGEEAYEWEHQLRARFALWSPGGALARELAKNPTVLIVNDTVFAHGGLMPEHIDYGLDKINLEVAQWMRADPTGEDGGQAPPPFIAMGDANSIMWSRLYSRERFASPYDKYRACMVLTNTLEKLNCSRMVVGHTPQMSGCNCECEGRIWRVDVGMSSGVLDARPEVLEITQDEAGQSSVLVLSTSKPMVYSPESSM